MFVLDPVHALVLLAFATLLAAAALSDFRHFTIPNRLSLAIVALYPAHVVASPMPVDWLDGLYAGGIVFGIGSAMFAFRVIGGGDVKLLAAAAIWAGLALLPLMLLVVLAVGAIYSLFEAIRLRYVQRLWARIFRPTEGGEALPREFVPYGVAISTGGIYVAITQFISSF